MDIAEAKADMDVRITKLREEIKTQLADLKTDLTWRMVISVGVVAGVVSAIVKIIS